jgi:ADP-ribose pyrophosphatase YjhB (NUDIX family)
VSSVKGSETDNSIRRQYPDRPIASVAAIVLRNERVLLVKRAKPPSQGLWSIPGGVVELGESFRETAERELEEECGIKIKVGRVSSVEDFIESDSKGRVRFHYVVTYVLAEYVSGEPRPGSDALGICWATASEMDDLEMDPVDRLVLKGLKKN